MSKSTFLAALLVPFFTHAAAESQDLASLRAKSRDTLVQGCMQAFVTPAIKSFMQRSKDAGQPVASEAEAVARLNASSQWTNAVLPGIRQTCECALANELAEIQEAASEQALMSRTDGHQRRMNDPGYLQSMEPVFTRCAQAGQN